MPAIATFINERAVICFLGAMPFYIGDLRMSSSSSSKSRRLDQGTRTYAGGEHTVEKKFLSLSIAAVQKQMARLEVEKTRTDRQNTTLDQENTPFRPGPPGPSK
ncbi:MAG: hypothetical protein MMC23_009396 [Stictis urceolatum]|nr:hypothetical protein [Stictis urceolata]